jgi:replicative DNA helicase
MAARKGFGKVQVAPEEGEEVATTTTEEASPPKKKKRVESSVITPEDDDPSPYVGKVFPPATEEEARTAGTEPSRARAPLKEIVDLDFESSRYHNAELEFYSLIQCIFDKDLQSSLWPRFVEEHFASESTRAIFRRLSGLLRIGKEWPGLMALSKDPALPSSAKAMLGSVVERVNQTGGWNDGFVTVAGKQISLATSDDYVGYIFDVLDAYRITREGLSFMVEAVEKVSTADDYDPLAGPALVEAAATSVLGVRGKETITDYLLNFGQFTTDKEDLKRQSELDSIFSDEQQRIQTGFVNFDTKAGGLLPGEVVLVGANSGGGKTAMMLSLMVNMARLGFPTAMLQLELTLGQLNERLSGNLAEVNTRLLRKGVIPKHTEKRVRDAWGDFHEELRSKKSRVTIFAPSSSNISQCEMYFKQYPYSVWFIDYVNLLEEASGNEGDGWQKLSAIVKKFKGLAKKYKVVIVLAVQVNVDKESGEISVRYAQGMKEHADVVWLWNLTKEARKDGVVWINNIKARQFEPFDWQIKVELPFARFSSMFSKDDAEPEPDTRKMEGKRQVTEQKAKPSSPATPPAPAKSKFATKPNPTPSADRVTTVEDDVDD